MVTPGHELLPWAMILLQLGSVTPYTIWKDFGLDLWHLQGIQWNQELQTSTDPGHRSDMGLGSSPGLDDPMAPGDSAGYSK